MNIYIEEDEYVVSLVIEKPDNFGDGFTRERQIIEYKRFKEPPKPGSLKHQQMQWILGTITGIANLGPFPK